jgi:hypothetical protein
LQTWQPHSVPAEWSSTASSSTAPAIGAQARHAAPAAHVA